MALGLFKGVVPLVEFRQEKIKWKPLAHPPRITFPTVAKSTCATLESQQSQKIRGLDAGRRELSGRGVQTETEVVLIPLVPHQDEVHSRSGSSPFGKLLVFQGLVGAAHGHYSSPWKAFERIGGMRASSY